MYLVWRLIRTQLRKYLGVLIIVFLVVSTVSATPYAFSFLGKWLVDEVLQVTGPPKPKEETQTSTATASPEPKENAQTSTAAESPKPKENAQASTATERASAPSPCCFWDSSTSRGGPCNWVESLPSTR